MKKILTTLLLCMSLATGFSQHVMQTLDVNKHLGIPIIDTTYPPFKKGELRTRPQDSLTYRWNGSLTGRKWDRLRFGEVLTVTDQSYDATTWNGSLEVPTKNAVRDKFESMTLILKGSTNWTPGIVAAGSSTSTTITVTGAVVGDPVTVSKKAGYSNGEIYDAAVTAPNTVTLRVHNVSTGSANYNTAEDYNVIVLKY